MRLSWSAGERVTVVEISVDNEVVSVEKDAGGVVLDIVTGSLVRCVVDVFAVVALEVGDVASVVALSVVMEVLLGGGIVVFWLVVVLVKGGIVVVELEVFTVVLGSVCAEVTVELTDVVSVAVDAVVGLVEVVSVFVEVTVGLGDVVDDVVGLTVVVVIGGSGLVPGLAVVVVSSALSTVVSIRNVHRPRVFPLEVLFSCARPGEPEPGSST